MSLRCLSSLTVKSVADTVLGERNTKIDIPTDIVVTITNVKDKTCPMKGKNRACGPEVRKEANNSVCMQKALILRD